VRIALVVIAAVAALTIAELMSDGFREFTGSHALVATFMTEGVLLVGVYLVIDEIIGRREARRWSDVTSLGMRALSALAHRPAEIIRGVVDDSGLEASSGGDLDYDEVVSDHADELAAWLRADETRARLFAEETRRSASRLEEAIIRWGPTLVEDPDSAELLNLLPDVVDSTRFVAQAIVPVAGWSDPAGGKVDAGTSPRGLTEEDRQRFRDCLREILRNVREFDRRRSSRS
jgi:hypothetical protein